MKCEDLQLNISLAVDFEITPEDEAILDQHLLHCPTCRVKLDEMRSLRSDLRAFQKPAIPAGLNLAIRSAVADELAGPQSSWFGLSAQWREFLGLQVMPYAIGTALSIALGITFLLSLDSTKRSTETVLSSAQIESNRTNLPPIRTEDGPFLTNEEFAAKRKTVSGESPSLNTRGPILALADSISDGKLGGDGVTLVADVFSNGLAQITEVVDAPQNQQKLDAITKALETDPNYAPFVSSEIDRRSDVVRVVFRIERVDVFEKTPPARKPQRN